MNNKLYKIVVFSPLSHSDVVLQVMGDAGAGVIGNYSHCTFSSVGTGRFLPLEGSHPYTGEVGKIEEVEEIRIETVCNEENIKKVMNEIRKVHPYEEVAFDIFPIIDEREFD